MLIELQYFPPVQFFSKLLHSKQIVIEQHEHYVKGSYRNRCYIVGGNSIQRLTIPLIKGKNQQQDIRAVKIAYVENWQAQHWQSIQSSYGKSPFFEFYVDELAPFFKTPEVYLFDWNLKLLKKLMDLLSIDCEITFTNLYQKTEELDGVEDWRNGIHPKKHLQKKDPAFQPIRYAQVFEERHGFLPNLSILDLLFCTGPGAGEILRQSIYTNP